MPATTYCASVSSGRTLCLPASCWRQRFAGYHTRLLPNLENTSALRLIVDAELRYVNKRILKVLTPVTGQEVPKCSGADRAEYGDFKDLG